MKFTTQAGGREIVVEIDEIDREFDQFNIAVMVDGKQRWSGWFHDNQQDEPSVSRRIQAVLDLRSSYDADRGNDVPLVENLQARRMLEELVASLRNDNARS